MPRMLPNRPDPDSPDSEKRVFKALRQGLPDDWICIHSRRFVLPATTNRSVKEGEIDFIVLHPRRGYICLEVKGGKVERDENDAWYSTDRHGERHSIKDPGRQAQNACRSISNYLRDRIQGPPLHYSWGVIFSDISVEGDLGPALPREIIGDRNDLGNPARQLETLLDSYDAPVKEIPRNVKEAFVSALAPTFSLVPLLRERLDEEAAELVRLTEEQKNALDYCQENRRVAVQGGAGTGKTILAMEKARRLVEEGKSVLFLCFNIPLADSLRETAEGFITMNFHRLCKEMATETGLDWDVPKDKDKEQAFWVDEAPELLLKGLELKQEKRYDAIIIDEGQDFKLHWWAAVEELLADKDSSHLYVFHDPNQDIYDGELSSDLGLTRINLTWNCRNTVRIAEYCSDLLKQDSVTKVEAPPGIPVKEARVTGGDRMVEEVRKLLHHYVNEEGISPERIVILTGMSLKRSPVYQAGKLGNHELIRLGDERESNSILIETLHRFKGLESDIAIVCDIDRSSKRFNPKKLYVAASRARLVLAVIEYEVEKRTGENPVDTAAVA